MYAKTKEDSKRKEKQKGIKGREGGEKGIEGEE